jgi:aldose 1-epimerase
MKERGMEVIELVDGKSGSTARIATSMGFNCFEFHARVGEETVDVIDAPPNFATAGGKPSGEGIPLLFPYPNRIRDGRYMWNGKNYEIPASNASYNASNAIHGFCLDRPWRVTSREANFAVGTFQLSKDAPDRLGYWPTDFRIEVRYEVRGPALRMDVRIINPSQIPLPWGFGTHPYFKLPLSKKSQASRCVVIAPASEEWELVNCLPTGRRLPISESKDLRDGAYFDVLKLDDVLTGLPAGRPFQDAVIMDEAAGLQVTQRFDPAFRELVVYTPSGRDAVCLEPYTCVTDAIHLQAQGIDTGWRVLEPGAEFRTWIEIAAGDVVA